LILCDVNVLIYAFRSDADNHLRYKSWLESTINGPSAYGIAPQVLASVIRISTHPRIFKIPSSLNDVFAFCRVLMEQANATVIVPGDRHWEIFESLCQGSQSTGNIAHDAWFAAFAIEFGCEWITTDRDYARFGGLSWRTPF
jgi:toxin-antitoxin system PIN domain toxin